MTHTKKIAVIGAGVSGITAAHVLQKYGHHVTVYEKSDTVGGVWAIAYPDVRLQNTWHQYSISDFDWPFTPDLHPTGAQIMRYLETAARELNIDVRLKCDVQKIEEVDDGWRVMFSKDGGEQEDSFDYVVIAAGQYSGDKHRPTFPGEDDFSGDIVSERDIKDLSIFTGKAVVVVGFGKSALDMATLAVNNGATVHHAFRTPRWLVPQKLLGLHFTRPFFSRFNSVMMTSWAHPTGPEAFLHKRLKFMVNGFWKLLSFAIMTQTRRYAVGKSEEARQRLKIVLPEHSLLPDFRSAAALAPENYYRYVIEGNIQPYHAELAGFSPTGIQLKNGEEIQCDMVILSLGSQSPTFPFLPETYRQYLEREADGTQLYRHLIHPRIPNLGFAGFNHGFMHIPAVEVGTLWLCALWEGQLELPAVEEMEQSIEKIRAWKRDNIHFEPSRSCAINTRYQQYLDIILKDLGLSPYRKTPNALAEIFMRYGASDYQGVLSEYQQNMAHNGVPRKLLEVDM